MVMKFIAKTMSGAFLHGCALGFIGGIFVSGMIAVGLMMGAR